MNTPNSRGVKFLSAAIAISALLSAPACAQEKDKRSIIRRRKFFCLTWRLMRAAGLKISHGHNVTARAGYDNQPSFTPNSQSFLYSRSGDYETDIFEYFIDSNTHKQLTYTKTSEFSPNASPDNKTISFVTDGPGANQNIAHIKRSRLSLQKPLLPGNSLREPIGYYSWDHSNGNVLFWSRYGYNITLTHADKQIASYITGDAVPSTPYVIPGSHNFSFVHQQGNGQMWIKELNPNTNAVRPLTPTVGANANYGWTPDASILMIENDTLYRWKEGSGSGWNKVADLSKHGIKGAARLNVSPDGKRLAIVGQAAEASANE